MKTLYKHKSIIFTDSINEAVLFQLLSRAQLALDMEIYF